MKTGILFLTPLLGAPALAQSATAPASSPAAPTPTPAPPIVAPVPPPAPAEEKETVIVVTAERNPQPITQTPSTVTVITRQQIEAKKPFDIIDVLRLAPGISISQSGTQGKTASIFTRGTNSNHTLVLIDGVRANSPADGRFDFSTFPVENIERIEILRGPQSSLYGSDAIGGVINIITRRGTGPLQVGAQLEAGNDSLNKQSFSAHGQVGRGGLSFTATRLKSDGEFDNDDYRNLAASLRYDVATGARSNLAFIGRLSDSKLGTPGQTDFTVDPNARSKPREIYGGLQFTNSAAHRRDQITLGIADRHLDFDDAINPDSPPASAASTDSTNKNRVLSLDAQSAFTLGQHTLTVGGETRRERADLDSDSTFGGFPSTSQFSRSTHTHALFVQDEWKTGRLTLAPGARYERNSQYGGNTSARLSASYALTPDSKLKASYGSAFKAPSFNDLYFPGYGNPDLSPEKSRGYEIGYEYTVLQTGRIEVTAFRNRIKDLIAGVATPTPADPFGFSAANINRAKTEGLELGADLPFGNGLRAVVNQTFLNTNSTPRLLRRPKFNTTADLIAQRGKASADLGLVAQGRRYDNDFQAPPFGSGRGPGIYGGYTRFDFTLGYDVCPGYQIYGRFQNLFDRDYEEAAGFRASGFNFVIGLKTAAF